MGWDESKPVAFSQWKTALATSGEAVQRQAMFARAIISFLHHCKTLHAPATIALARSYLDAGQPPKPPASREALRWFFQQARLHPGEPPRHRSSAAPPPPAALDPGDTGWEQILVAACRERGFLWRTEETYRTWGRRFALFIRPRSPETAGPEEVSAFLSALAVDQRASASTQRQALNALVFLIQEGFKRQLGELPFKRALPGARIPIVLTQAECGRLFAAIKGTPRLMAETMYGAGLRLMELLRLRIHHLDFPRGQIHVRGGKGDRVNGGADAVPELN